MPRYFFYILREGRLIADDEGAELSDLDAVKEEGLASAREMMIEALKQQRSIGNDRIEIKDENGQDVLIVPVRSVID